MFPDRIDENASSWEQVTAGLFHPEWRVRVGAAKALIRFPEQVSISVLMLALSDEHEAVRSSVLETCAALAERVSVVLVKSMLLDSVWSVRATAAWALGRFGDKAPLDDLLVLLEDKTEVPLVRASALHALGELGERVPIEVIVAALRDDEWPVREVAAITLGTLGERAPVEPLIYALHHDDVEFVRTAAALSLGRLADRARQTELVKALSDKDPSVCRAAVWALGEAKKEKRRRDISDDGEAIGTTNWSFVDVVRNELDRPRPPGTQKRGNVEFSTLEPADLRSVPVIAQALDNQWLPRSLLRPVMAGNITYEDCRKYLERLVRTEYIRALINGQQVVVNRAYLYSNPAIFKDYISGQQNRDAFKALLHTGVIVPFLFKETCPDEPPPFGTHPDGFPAWRELCQEVHMFCLRFDWDDERNQSRIRTRLARRFDTFALQLETGDIKTYMKDLVLDASAEGLFKKRMHEVARTCVNARSRGKDRLISRDDLYKLFVTVGNNPAERHYDSTKLFAGEIKQLLDLAYNSYLADALYGYLLTPADSLARIALQEWSSVASNAEEVTAEQLLAWLRRDTCPPVQEGVYLKSLSQLDLGDVVVLRGMEEWNVYIEHVENLLRHPFDFATLAPLIYRAYVALSKRMSELVQMRQGQSQSTIVRKPVAELIIDIAGAALSVLWLNEGPIYMWLGEEQPREMPSGFAPVICRLNIREWGESPDSMDLFTSLEFMRGKMQVAQERWNLLQSGIREMVDFKEVRAHADVSQATLNARTREQTNQYEA